MVYEKPNIKPSLLLFKKKDTDKLKVSGWKKIHHGNTNPKKAGLAILISTKADFRTGNIARDKEGHFITTKTSI